MYGFLAKSSISRLNILWLLIRLVTADLKLIHLHQWPITLVAPLNERGILCPCGLIDHVISFDVSPSQASAKSRQSGRLSQVEGQLQQHEPQLLAVGRSISCVPIDRPVGTLGKCHPFLTAMLVGGVLQTTLLDFSFKGLLKNLLEIHWIGSDNFKLDQRGSERII